MKGRQKGRKWETSNTVTTTKNFCKKIIDQVWLNKVMNGRTRKE